MRELNGTPYPIMDCGVYVQVKDCGNLPEKVFTAAKKRQCPVIWKGGNGYFEFHFYDVRGMQFYANIYHNEDLEKVSCVPFATRTVESTVNEGE